MKKIVVLTGAGISAESGIKTFRDADGLWEGHDVMEVATPQGWAKSPETVLRFYNERRRQLQEVVPNIAHLALVQLEQKFEVTIITQNVDDLHERAGSTNVMHLHGELLKARSQVNPELITYCNTDIKVGDSCAEGGQLRPHIVWFGEEVPMLDNAIDSTSKADIVIVIGTSMQVYPAASLIQYTKTGTQKFFIDPAPSTTDAAIHVIAQKATLGVPHLVQKLLKEY